MELEIRNVEFASSLCRTRIPFRFGIVTLIEAPVIVARVRIRAGDSEFTGHSADLTVPKWFDKNPATSASEDIRALFASAERKAQQEIQKKERSKQRLQLAREQAGPPPRRPTSASLAATTRRQCSTMRSGALKERPSAGRHRR